MTYLNFCTKPHQWFTHGLVEKSGPCILGMEWNGFGEIWISNQFQSRVWFADLKS